jgi:hypothetical protein
MEHRTTKPEYVEPLLATLGRLGRASEEVLLDETFQSIKSSLYPADLALLPNGVPRWRNQMQNMLDGLIDSGRISKKDGVLRIA